MHGLFRQRCPAGRPAGQMYDLIHESHPQLLHLQTIYRLHVYMGNRRQRTVFGTRLVNGPQTTPYVGSLRSMRGPAPTTPLNTKTPAVATDRLVCAPPCVWTAKPPLTWARFVRQTARFARRGGQPPHSPLNTKTLAVAIDHLLCAPPCVWIAKPPLTSAHFAGNVEFGGDRQGGLMD